MPDVIRRNTRSLRLNLKKPEGREVFEKLVQTVDVVVEGFRPGVAKKLGMDYEEMSSDEWFRKDPAFAWGVNYRQLNMYRY